MNKDINITGWISGICIVTLTCWLPLTSLSQEMVTGLQINPVVKQQFLHQQAIDLRENEPDTIPVLLPFFDDFRKPTVFPDTSRWLDRYAFVNTDIPLFPVNRGAVTLDAISDSGMMYPQAVPGPQTFLADHLTSRYIRLDSVFDPAPRALSPADSVYLSFWYQPQGRGKPPHAADSLLLRFLVKPAWDSITPTDTTHIEAVWEDIWSSAGMSLDTFYLKNNTYFAQIMIPVTDPKFFKKTFLFQFYNYVSLASSTEPSWQSNCSQWNLDNIYLNAGRGITDTLQPEITFVERPPSMLRNYASMPYPQYSDNPTNEMADTVDMLMSNRDSQNHNAAYTYTMQNESGSWSKTYNGGEYIMKPFYQFGYVTYIPFAHPPVQYLFPVSAGDSALFPITHAVGALDGSGLGDTMHANQVFYNYYAYDDGTPDAGYGLTPAGSLLAYRFRLNKSPDTLRAVHIFFNRTLSGNNVQLFRLKVWNDNNNKPGELLADTLVYPRFADSLNKFVTYHFDPPVRITGTFYVGWEQTTDDNLNVGYDRYNNSRENILFNVFGYWETSVYSGSLMIRPVVGKPIPLGIPSVRPSPSNLAIYPNPAGNDKIKVTLPDEFTDQNGLIIQVRSLFGQILKEELLTGETDISQLATGMYIITLAGIDHRILATGKLMVIR